MDKLLIGDYGDFMLFDADENAFKYSKNIASYNVVLLAEKDGQAITSTEVIDYKKGDLVLNLRGVTKKEQKTINKVIVVSGDEFAKYDLQEWFNRLKNE